MKKFYDNLAGEAYLKEIRRFGLRYDEMIDTVVDILSIDSPIEILDIGCGVGNVEEKIVKKLPNTKITCIELSPEMVKVAKKRLERYDKRKISILCKNILEFEPNKKFDVIISNLVIHNMPRDKKIILLKKIKRWLKPKGVFIWGEFMGWEDQKVEKHLMEYRIQKVLESGASLQFVKEVLAKEAKDFRLTVTETVDLLKKCNFKKPEVLWVYSFLAIFRVRK